MPLKHLANLITPVSVSKQTKVRFMNPDLPLLSLGAGAKKADSSWGTAPPISGPSLPRPTRQASSISPKRLAKAPRIESESVLRYDAPHRGWSPFRSQLPTPSLSGATRGPQAPASSRPKPPQVPPINPESSLQALQNDVPPRGRSPVRSRLPVPSSSRALSKRDSEIRDQVR